MYFGEHAYDVGHHANIAIVRRSHLDGCLVSELEAALAAHDESHLKGRATTTRRALGRAVTSGSSRTLPGHGRPFRHRFVRARWIAEEALRSTFSGDRLSIDLRYIARLMYCWHPKLKSGSCPGPANKQCKVWKFDL